MDLQNNTPIPSQNMTKNEPPSQIVNNAGSNKKIGPTIAIFVILIILISIAIFLFASKANHNQLPPLENSQSIATQQAVEPITNTNDDVHSLQTDLNNSTTGVDTQNF